MQSMVQESGARGDCERSGWSGTDSLRQSVRIEHYRLHCVEEWPDSPYREVVLAAVHSALKRQEAAAIGPFDPPACMICTTRRSRARMLTFPSRPEASPAIVKPAA